MSLQIIPVFPARATKYSYRLYNAELASRMKSNRQTATWARLSAFWMSDVHSVGTYMFAASLYALGLCGMQLGLGLLIGALALQFLSNLITKPSQLTGVPFAVAARMAFGVYGARVALAIRVAVSSVWFGIQSYFAQRLVCALLVHMWPALEPFNSSARAVLGLPVLGWLAFTAVFAAQLVLSTRDSARVRIVGELSRTIVFTVMVALAAHVLSQVGIMRVLSEARVESEPHGIAMGLWRVLAVAGLTVAFFGAALLRQSDAARDCESYDEVKLGNQRGLFIGLAGLLGVTLIVRTGSSSMGPVVRDPIALLASIDAPWVSGALLAAAIATVCDNVNRHAESAGFDAVTLSQERLLRSGARGLCALAGCVWLPWLACRTPNALFTTLDLLGACVGPLLAVMIVDFYAAKQQRIKLDDLYSDSCRGHYWYEHGTHKAAWLSLISGVCVGFGLILVASCFSQLHPVRALAHSAWLLGGISAGSAYRMLGPQAARAITPAQVIRVRQVL